MFDEFAIFYKLLTSVIIGYVLGSIPFAQAAARLRGADLFATGNRTAGTANVFWNVGHRTGMLVFAGDVAKGSAAVLSAHWIGVAGPLLLLAAGGAIVGHWNSVFTGFRGGDGMATLIGVSLTLLTQLTLLGIAIGMLAVILMWRSPYRSAWGIVTCFAVILGVSQYYQASRDMGLGLVVLAMLVLFHNVFFHRRRTHAIDAAELDLDIDMEMDTDNDLGLPSAPENH